MVRIIVGIVAPRLVATVVSLALIVWAVSGFIALSESSTVRSLARAIEMGGEPKPEVLDQLHQDRSFERLLSKCDTANLRALIVVRLKEIDVASAMADLHRVNLAYEGAEAAIRKSLICAPLDGNLWLRLAILDTARRGPSSKTIELFRLSHWTAPSEGWVARARIEFSSRLFAAGIKDVEPELRSDIRTIVSFDMPNNIAEMFFLAPHPVRPIYREWIDLLSERRKVRVIRAIESRGGNLNGT
jgi:hypothetical protein